MKVSTLALAGLGVFALSRVTLRRTGATRWERTRPLPGDDVVPGARGSWTMATTIDAPPAAVWQWLVQIGSDRAGFYSFDHLDNAGRPSVEEIRPEWQTLAVGDRLASTPSGRGWFVVSELEPERSLVLRASFDPFARCSYDPAGEGPRFYVDSSWAFVLEPLASRTRLLVRTKSAARPALLARLANVLFFDPAHWIMQTRQLIRIRHLAETSELARST
jgi:hypothetical protein